MPARCACCASWAKSIRGEWGGNPPLLLCLPQRLPHGSLRPRCTLTHSAPSCLRARPRPCCSYFDADRLAGGVAAAQAFHASLAAASAATPQRGTTMPPVALRGLCAVYAAAVQPQRSLKLDFLRALLRRFRGAASIDAACAADADLALLAFLASVAAYLPYRRGDEPCTLVQEVNALVSTRGESVLLDLRCSLEAAEAAAGVGSGDGGGEGPAPAAAAAEVVPPALAAQVKASLALSMLLVLKDYLKAAYGLTSERIAAFGSTGEKRKTEERQVGRDWGLLQEEGRGGAALAMLRPSSSLPFRCLAPSARRWCRPRIGRSIWTS